MTRPKPLCLASSADLAGIGGIALTTPLASLVPERSLPALARLFAGAALRLDPDLARSGAEEMRRRLGGEMSDPEAARLFREHYGRRWEHLLGKMRDTAAGWHPEATLAGVEHLHGALERGRGAVLWGMSFCGHVVPKAALRRAGFEVHHLSSPYHGGFSRTWLARRILNPWTLRSENRYLAGRSVLPRDGSLQYLLVLKQRLLDNGCVSIAGEHIGRRNVTVVFLNGRASFATGAASLARATGAALLTVYSCRRGPARYVTTVEPPIERVHGADRRTAVSGAVQEFAERLQRHVYEHPADWDRWSARDPA
jgi:lauroyl/myristoyl acyltransferase